MIKEIIVVEGKYDKIKLDSILDGAVVIATNGFRIFKDKEKTALLRKYAKERGVVVLTDSDSAGFLIRNHLKKILGNDYIKNAYIPEIKGKEKRKNAPSKEGLLGVEGISKEIILDALKKAGCGFEQRNEIKPVTKLDLFNDGYVGKPDSSERRIQLLKKLGLPEKLSVNALLDALNTFVGYDEYKEKGMLKYSRTQKDSKTNYNDC